MNQNEQVIQQKVLNVKETGTDAVFENKKSKHTVKWSRQRNEHVIYNTAFVKTLGTVVPWHGRRGELNIINCVV